MLSGDTPEEDREVENRTAEYQRMGMSQVLAQNTAVDHTRRSASTRSDYADHHMYPRSLGNHALFAALGMTIDDPSNIIRLPTHSGVNSRATVHCGCQNRAYTTARQIELDGIWDELRNGDINKGDAKKRLKDSMDRLRTRHLDGTMMLNRASERARDERAARDGGSGGSGSGGRSPRAQAAIRNNQTGLY
jgi:A nuclease family of the HNH/ENDO VII superfamily with conserved AHH